MPIVIDYNDPSIVLNLANNAGQYAETANQRNVITRPGRGSINDPMRIASDVVGQPAPALQGGPGGTGVLPTPDGRGGITGGARIYYPEGTQPPPAENYMLQQGAQQAAADNQLGRQLQLAAGQQQIRAGSQLGVNQAKLQEADQLIDQLAAAGTLTPDQAAQAKLRARSAGIPGAAAGPSELSTNREGRIADKEALSREAKAIEAEIANVEDAIKADEARAKALASSVNPNKATSAKNQGELDAIRQGIAAARADLTKRRQQLADTYRGPGRSAAQPAAADSRESAAPADDLGTESNPFKPRSMAEYQSLPAGTVYVAPDGTIRKKK